RARLPVAEELAALTLGAKVLGILLGGALLAGTGATKCLEVLVEVGLDRAGVDDGVLLRRRGGLLRLLELALLGRDLLGRLLGLVEGGDDRLLLVGRRRRRLA